jgi:hypothetical protein
VVPAFDPRTATIVAPNPELRGGRVSGPVVVNNPPGDSGNSSLIIGVVVVIIVLIVLWWLFFANGSAPSGTPASSWIQAYWA